jgi:cytochrome P450
MMDTSAPPQVAPSASGSASASARELRDLPGPRRWPLIGNLAQIDVPRMHAQLESWAEEYGPLYRLRLGPRDAVVVSRPDLIAPILRERPDNWRRMKAMQVAIQEIGSHGLFSVEGDEWRRQRRMVMAAFDPGHLKRYFASLVQVTERLLLRLNEAARTGESIDLQTVLMRYSVDVTAGLAFGVDINTQQHPDNVLRSHLDKVFPMLMRRINAPFPWWRYLRLPSDRAFDRHLEKVHEAVRGFVRAARDRMALDPGLRERPTNLLEALIAARDDEGTGLTEQDLVGNVLTVLLAGEDTTANTLGWTLYLLHTRRDVWDELVASVDNALGADDLPRSFDVARGFEFIEQCAQESMRLRPVAPLFFFENNAQTSIDGLRLPEGTMVILIPRKGAVDTRVVADAAEFRPARWGENANTAPANMSADAMAARGLLKAAVPFGAGPRLCPGRYLAMLEMKMVIATIARNFELIDVSTEDGEPPRERIAFTMFPVGLNMKLAPRASTPSPSGRGLG